MNSTTRADAHHDVTNFEVDGMIWNKKRNILRANNHFSVKKKKSFYIVIQKLWFQKLSFFGWGNLYLVLSGTFLFLEKAQTEARKKILFNIWTHGSMGMPTPWHKLKKDYYRYNLRLTFVKNCYGKRWIVPVHWHSENNCFLQEHLTILWLEHILTFDCPIVVCLELLEYCVHNFHQTGLKIRLHPY